MNIISNNCAGAAIYRYVLHSEYKNPFIWCFTDLKTLIPNYQTINWSQINIYCSKSNLQGNWHLCIDHLIDLTFIHAVWDPNYNEPFIDGANVRYSRIWCYLKNKYLQRINRMLYSNDPPIYVVNIQHANHIELADYVKTHTEKYLIISPVNLYPSAHITYQPSNILNPSNPLAVIESCATTINNALQIYK